jgi:hypothetical protein
MSTPIAGLHTPTCTPLPGQSATIAPTGDPLADWRARPGSLAGVAWFVAQPSCKQLGFRNMLGH